MCNDSPNHCFINRNIITPSAALLILRLSSKISEETSSFALPSFDSGCSDWTLWNTNTYRCYTFAYQQPLIYLIALLSQAKYRLTVFRAKEADTRATEAIRWAESTRSVMSLSNWASWLPFWDTLRTDDRELREKSFYFSGKKQQEHTNRGRGTQNTCARREHSSAASGHVSLHGKHSPEHRFSSAPLPNHSPVSSGGGAPDPAQQPTSQPADQCDIIIIASVCWKALLLTTIVSLTLVWFLNSSVKLTAFSSSSWLSSICESKDRHATLRFWWPDWQKERKNSNKTPLNFRRMLRQCHACFIKQRNSKKKCELCSSLTDLSMLLTTRLFWT